MQNSKIKKRCAALTKEGNQCSRWAVVRDLCTQHDKMTTTVVHKHTDPPLWTTMGFTVDPDPRNGSSILQKIRTLLTKGPKHNDAPGKIYIYFYQRDKEQNLSYWKIGRTTQHVEKRMAQWSTKEKSTTLKWCRTTRYNVFCESLIFLWLDFFRMHRTPRLDKQGYHSVNQKSGEIIKDKQSVIEKEEQKKLLIAKNKETEWFNADYQYVKKVVSSIMNALIYYNKK